MRRSVIAALALAALGTAAARAQAPTSTSWPTKPVRISVPVTAGSAIDLVCRTVFDQVSQQMGQAFIIDNRGGGGGTLAPAAVAKADPDGYTLLLPFAGVHDLSRDPSDASLRHRARLHRGYRAGQYAVPAGGLRRTVQERRRARRRRQGEPRRHELCIGR